MHKQNLAVGPRSSRYFAQLFRGGGRFAESRTATSRISLAPLAAEHFKALLDYLYAGTLELTHHPNRTVALYSMAKYFDMRRLRWETKQQWESDLAGGDAYGAASYYALARLFHEENLRKASLVYCTQRVMEMKPSTCHLVKVCEPSAWLSLLQQRPLGVDSQKFQTAPDSSVR